MKPSVAAALIGLLVALLPWLPPCPARIAAADLPPPPPRGANLSADGAEAQAATAPGAGTNSNSVQSAVADKTDARSVLPINEPPASAPNCSRADGTCTPHLGTLQLPANATRAAKDAAPGPGADLQQPEEAPLPAGSEISSGPVREGQGEAPPDLNTRDGLLNALEEATAAGREGPSTPSPPATPAGRGLGPSLLGNHVFPTAPEGLGPPRATPASKMAAADEDFVDSVETSTRVRTMPPVTSTRGSTTSMMSTTPVTSTPAVVTSTPEKRGKLQQQKAAVRKQKGKGVKEDEEPEAEDEDSHTTDGLFYRHFTRMESQEFEEEPGTTRSYHVVEKSTRLDYSSSHVVSETYDSDSSPAEEEDDQEDAKGRSGGAAPEEDEEASESPDYVVEEERMEENVDAVQTTTVAAVSEAGGKDQDPASSEGEGAVARGQPGAGITAAPTTEEATTAAPAEEVTSKGNLMDADGPEDSSQTDAPPALTVPLTTEAPKEASSQVDVVGYATVQSTTSTTMPSPRTSRRLGTQRSTTESPVKNEVTYNETVTGSAYGFKANLSFTTPMVLLLSAVPSTFTEPSVTETDDQIQSTTPLTSSQATDQSLTGVLLVSTAATTPTTELTPAPKEQVESDDEQGGGNSINDWTTISSGVNEESSKDPESTTVPTTSPQAQSYESSTADLSSSPTTSSVLFTTVQNASVSDLVSESMSINSTSEEATTVPMLSSTSAPASESVSERTGTDITAPFGSGNDSSSVSSTVNSTPQSTVPPDNDTTIASTDAPSTVAELSSSTNAELLPDLEKTKVPTQGLVDKEGSSGSDSSTKEVKKITEAITVQPPTTSIGQNTTSTMELISTTPATTKGTPPKTTFVPIVVKLNSSSTAGMTHTSYNISDAIGGGDEESEESVVTYPWHVRLVMEISWSEMCDSRQQNSLKQALAQLISTALMSNAAHSVLPTDRVLLLNVAESCPNASGSPSEVHFCILSAVADPSLGENRGVIEDWQGGKGTTVVHCDPNLMQLFLNIWDKMPKPTVEPLMHVKEVGIAHSSHNVDVPMTPADDSTGVQAAIGISCIAALALFLLAALLIIMRRRQRRFNYGQRCTPVSLDAYSLDSVSVREGSRRQARNGDAGGRRGVNGLSKGNDGLSDWRASKRSYGNPAFEDDDGEEVLLSKPMNLATLTNAALDDDSALADEFRLIPKRFHKRTVRRKSRAKNKAQDTGAAERGEVGGSACKDNDEDDDHLPEGAEEKNRYANVVPLPSTRVRLSARPSGPLSTYINANFVRGPKNEERFYIACQAPLKSTIEDFWRMIWEQQSKVILMLTNLVENSVEKCADYLPPSEVLDCHRLFGDFQVTLKKREVREKYIVSSLQLKNMESNLWREVTHFWFLGWPDQGVPDEPNQVIAFLIEARPLIKTNSGPTVVHCSPGTGRTGTVIAIDICIRDFEQSRMIDVPKVVQQLRRDREGSVQTQQQYAFIYKALSLYAAKLTGGAMDSF